MDKTELLGLLRDDPDVRAALREAVSVDAMRADIDANWDAFNDTVRASDNIDAPLYVEPMDDTRAATR